MRQSYKKPLRFSGHNLALYISLLALIVVSYGWRIAFLEDSFGYDQGIHLILARLWAAGYEPYEEIFVSYPPLFIWSLGLPWQLFSQASALQLLMSSYALTGVIAVVYLGSVYHSRLAGLVAGVLLSFTPAYFAHSITVMGEVPSIGVAVVAIALAEKYRRAGGWGWLVLAGATLAVSLSLKILPFYAVPFVGLIVTARYIEVGNFWQRLQASKWLLLRDLAILGSSFLLAFLLPVIFFNPAALYDQVVGMRLVSREAQLNIFRSNNRPIITFIFGNSGLTALALYGLVFVVTPRLKNYGLLLVGFMLIWASMVVQVPLRGKHLPIFLPTLALFSGFAVDHIYHTLKQIPTQRWALQTPALLLVILVVLALFSWDVTETMAGNTTVLAQAEDEEEVINDREALEFIAKISTPTDCVVADDPVFLYHTQRLPPPELSEVSHTRIETGYLSLQDMINSIQLHQCHVVAALTPRFNQDIPGLPEWLAVHYLGLYKRDQLVIYFAKKGADNQYTPLPAHQFGDVVQLYGLSLSTPPWDRDKPAFISLYWRLEATLQQSYIEQITLRNSTGEQAFRVIRRPFEGQFDPALWQVNEQARDTFWLNLPVDLPPGNYDLYLSLCEAETEPCLPLQNQQGQTELRLGQIQVVE
jgi:hypothetical protein